MLCPDTTGSVYRFLLCVIMLLHLLCVACLRALITLAQCGGEAAVACARSRLRPHAFAHDQARTPGSHSGAGTGWLNDWVIG